MLWSAMRATAQQGRAHVVQHQSTAATRRGSARCRVSVGLEKTDTGARRLRG
jgi:hypothetical protein